MTRAGGRPQLPPPLPLLLLRRPLLPPLSLLVLSLLLLSLVQCTVATATAGQRRSEPCQDWRACATPRARPRRVNPTRLPCGGLQVSRRAMASVSLSASSAAAAALSFPVAICFATMLPLLLTSGLAWPKRFGWHCLAQCAFTWGVLRRLPAICSSPLFSHPAAQGQMGAAYSVLHVASSALVGPAAARGSPPPPAVQCQAVLAVVLCLLGGLLPIACAARWQAQELEVFAAGRRRGVRRPWWARWLAAPRIQGGGSQRLALWLALVHLACVAWDFYVFLLVS